MVYLKNIYTILQNTTVYYGAYELILHKMVSFWESAWSFDIIPLHSFISTIQYLVESPRDCDYDNNPLSPIISHPHSRNVCYFFSSI